MTPLMCRRCKGEYFESAIHAGRYLHRCTRCRTVQSECAVADALEHGHHPQLIALREPPLGEMPQRGCYLGSGTLRALQADIERASAVSAVLLWRVPGETDFGGDIEFMLGPGGEPFVQRDGNPGWMVRHWHDDWMMPRFLDDHFLPAEQRQRLDHGAWREAFLAHWRTLA